MKYLTLLVMFLMLLSCGDKGVLVPDVPVNFHASLNDPRLNALNGAGGAVSLNGYGVAGIIIYRRADNAYMAYDRCSTVNPEQKCAVVIDDPNLTATDPCSGAKYSLYDGAPVKAPAKKSLKQYQVIVTSFEISVVN
jgi:nitrite reductase/ring-hydroxylating ferredoxin subunit